MKHTRKIAYIAGLAISGLILSLAITFTTAQVKSASQQTSEGCHGADYIISGFPVRDIYVREYHGGECGLTYIEMGNTGIGKVPLIINWVVWGLLLYMLANRLQQVREARR